MTTRRCRDSNEAADAPMSGNHQQGASAGVLVMHTASSSWTDGTVLATSTSPRTAVEGSLDRLAPRPVTATITPARASAFTDRATARGRRTAGLDGMTVLADEVAASLHGATIVQIVLSQTKRPSGVAPVVDASRI